MSAHHLPRETYILREMLCGHNEDIYLQGYMSAQYPSSVSAQEDYNCVCSQSTRRTWSVSLALQVHFISKISEIFFPTLQHQNNKWKENESSPVVYVLSDGVLGEALQLCPPPLKTTKVEVSIRYKKSVGSKGSPQEQSDKE